MKLNTYEWGDESAPLVVCLHGVTGHGLRFRKLAEERLANRFHVVAADLRGHGHSTWDEPWDIATHVADLLETFDRPAYWIGHSFGGRLTMEVAAVRPELVRRAVLLDPAIFIPPFWADDLAADARKKESYSSVDEAIQTRIVRSGLAHTPREILEEEVAVHGVEQPDGRHRLSLFGELRRRRVHGAGEAGSAVRRPADPDPRRRRVPVEDRWERARSSSTSRRSATCSRSRSCPAATASSGTRSTRPPPRSTRSSRA